MPEIRKVMITLPENLLREVDVVVQVEKKNRSEFIREILIGYLQKRKRKETEELLKQGYLQLAQIHREIAEVAVGVETETLEAYEQNIAEE